MSSSKGFLQNENVLILAKHLIKLLISKSLWKKFRIHILQKQNNKKTYLYILNILSTPCSWKKITFPNLGKTARKTIADLADGKQVKIPPTIEDPTVYKNIKLSLQKIGYAINAPDPQ